jgi:hypothetical protein
VVILHIQLHPFQEGIRHLFHRCQRLFGRIEAP